MKVESVIVAGKGGRARFFFRPKGEARTLAMSPARGFDNEEKAQKACDEFLEAVREPVVEAGREETATELRKALEGTVAHSRLVEIRTKWLLIGMLAGGLAASAFYFGSP